MYRVAIPLDGSELSERALPLAQAMARSLHAPLELIHILEEPIAFDLVPSLVLPDRLSAEQYLTTLRQRLPADLEVRTSVVRGNAAEELMRAAAEEAGAIVVMSTHGRGGLGRLVFGSVADKVMRGASVPVVMVRDAPRPGYPGLRNLLLPLDGSELAESMLPLATALTRDSGAALHLVRVVEPAWSGAYGSYGAEIAYLSPDQLRLLEQEALGEAREYLDRVASELRERGVRVIWEVRAGKPAEEIARAAETIDADLVVMSSHGRGGIRRWAFGSVANALLQRSHVPVMVMPPHAQLHGVAETDAIAPIAVD